MEDVTIDFKAALGSMVWLSFHSPLHRNWPIASLEDNFWPALKHGQCKIYYDGEQPNAFVTWALLDHPSHNRLLADGLTPGVDKWNSGKNLWFIDIVAPFGNALGVIRDLQRNYFSEYNAHSIKRNSDGTIARIKKWRNYLSQVD